MRITQNRLFAHYGILLLSLVLLPVLAISGFAAEIQVPSQFSTIQAAIDASQNGDVIIVQPGTYAENINFNGKAITLTSTNPLDPTIVANTIIDGSMNGSVVTFDSEETSNSVLTGFTIRNGNGTLIDGKRYGGGIYCGLRSTPTIRHNKIINNTADVGGAIYIHGNSPPTITNGPNVDYPYVSKSQTVGLSVTATDPDNDTLVYRWVPREGGTITGTGSNVSFSAATAGVYHIDLTVDDQHGGKATGVVTVTVIGVVIQTMPQLKAGQSASVSATVTPSIANSPQYPVSIIWSVIEGPAAGTFDAAVNGTPGATSINFTPSASGPGRIQATYQVGTALTSHSVAMALNPIVISIDPVSGSQNKTIQITITGNNLGRVSSVSLSGTGVTASIGAGKTENSLPVQFVISKEAAAGNRTISLTTPENQFSTSLTFQIIALPPVTANPTSLSLTVGEIRAITFSIPGPAPAGGVNLTLSSSATSVATVPASATIAEGQSSVQVNVTSVGIGTATITADAAEYTKVQVPVTALNPIGCGQLMTGSISAAGEKDSYTFTASAGDIMTIRASKTSGNYLNMNIELYGPIGALVGSTYNATVAQLNRTLTEAGTYTVVVRDYYNVNTGAYTLTWQRLNGPCGATALVCGQVVVASIGVAGELDPYIFTVAANEVVTIRASRTSGSYLVPQMELYDSAGTLIVSAANVITRTFTAGGTYTVLLRDSNSLNTGGYAITWQSLVNPCNATVVNCGHDVSGTIDGSVSTPPWNVYSFTATANDVVTIRASKTSGNYLNMNMELYGPTGALVGSTYNATLAQLNKTLTDTGSYTVVMRDYSNIYTGSYTLTWEKLNGPCGATALSCGQVVIGSIGVADQINPYTLTVSDNEVVTIRASGTSSYSSLVPQLELYDSAGALVVSAVNVITRTFTTGGTYTVLVRDSNSYYTGGYAITWQSLVNPCAASIACGQDVSGTIGGSVSTPPWGFYAFTGSAGDVVTIRARQTTGNYLYPNIELYGPTGALLGSTYSTTTAQLDRTLTEAGTYTIVVRDYSNANTGTYTLTWEKLNGPCGATELSCGQVVIGSIGVADQINPYTLTVSDNEVVTIRASRTSGSYLVPQMELYDSAGTLIVSAANVITRTFTAGGTYTVLVRDSNSYYTGGYAITWQSLVNPCAASIACGQDVSGTIGGSVGTPPWGFYMFTGPVGDAVTILASKTSGSYFYPNIELYGPSGALVGSTYSTTLAQLDRTLTEAGTYTIVVRDYNNIYTGTYTLNWQMTNGPCP